MHTKKAAKNRIQTTARHVNRPFGARLLNFAAATLSQHFGQERQIKPCWVTIRNNRQFMEAVLYRYRACIAW